MIGRGQAVSPAPGGRGDVGLSEAPAPASLPSAHQDGKAAPLSFWGQGPVRVWNPRSTSWTDACHRGSGDHSGEGVTRPERQRRKGQCSREVAEVQAGAGPAQQTKVPSSPCLSLRVTAAGARRPTFYQDKQGGRGQPSFTLPWLERPWRWSGTFEAVVPSGAEEAGGVLAGGSSLTPVSCSTVS